MSRFWTLLRLPLILILACLAGCGTYVPPIAEVWDQPNGKLSASGVIELEIKTKVYCELKDAVKAASGIVYYRDNVPSAALPDDWGVQFTIALQIDETGAINPGALLTTPMSNAVNGFPNKSIVTTPQSFGFGFGGTLSSQATRVDKISAYYDVGKLKKSLETYDSCIDQSDKGRGGSLLLESDLGIRSWLYDAVIANNTYKSTPLSASSDPSFKQDILSYEVKFNIISSGNVTPTWKLVRITANNGTSPLLSVNRTRSHDLLITFGPSQKPTSGKGREPSASAAYSHLASQIGLAVGNNLRVTAP